MFIQAESDVGLNLQAWRNIFVTDVEACNRRNWYSKNALSLTVVNRKHDTGLSEENMAVCADSRIQNKLSTFCRLHTTPKGMVQCQIIL
jgi:hypothetical protein